jgi:hypothetical protein
MFSHVLYYINKSIASPVRHYHQFEFINQFHFVCRMDEGFSQILSCEAMQDLTGMILMMSLTGMILMMSHPILVVKPCKTSQL